MTLCYVESYAIQRETIADLLATEGKRYRGEVTSRDGNVVDQSYRSTVITDLNADDWPDVQYALSVAVTHLRPTLELRDINFTELQIARYDINDHFSRHKDNGGKLSYRKFTSVTLLDASPDLQGGELKMWNSNNEEYVVPLSVGDTVVFDSSVFHQVNPVTQGNRTTLIGWAQVK